MVELEVTTNKKKGEEESKEQAVVLQKQQINNESSNNSTNSQQTEPKQDSQIVENNNMQDSRSIKASSDFDEVAKEEKTYLTDDAQTTQQQQHNQVVDEQLFIENAIVTENFKKIKDQKSSTASSEVYNPSFDHLNDANQNFNRSVNQNDSNPNIVKPPPNTIWFYNRDEPYYEFTNFKENFPIKAALASYMGNQLEVKSWPTSEHLFQAAKFQKTKREICDMIRKCHKPRDAFNMARKYQQFIDPDWQEINIKVMEWVVKKKFEQHPTLAKRLLGTGDKTLVEHTELDRFWGDGGDGTGKNMLGIILMSVRKDLRDTNYLENLEKSRRKSEEIVAIYNVNNSTTNNELYLSPSESSSTNSLATYNNNDGNDDSQKYTNLAPPPPPPKKPQNKNKILTADGIMITPNLDMQTAQNNPMLYYGYPSSLTPPPSNPQNQSPYNPYND